MPRGDTKNELIRTTQALLWERGYAATSPRTILDRAAVGQGSMYHHFSGKEALAIAAFERTAATLTDGVAAVLHGPGTAVERVAAYLQLERNVLRGCPVGRMAADADVLDSPELRDVLAAAFGRLRALVVDVLAEGARRGELGPRLDPVELADMVLAIVQGGHVIARAAGNPEPFDRAIRGAVALLRRAGDPNPNDDMAEVPYREDVPSGGGLKGGGHESTRL